MQQQVPGHRVPNAPNFYLTGREPLRPGVLLLAVAVAASALFLVSYGLGRASKRHFRPGRPTASRPTGGASGSSSAADDEDDDDPNQIDTIVLGDAADAPVPARREDLAGKHRPRDVHPTILIRLPRYGEQVGLIPDTPTGHLLYRWLAAFNQASGPALDAILPNTDTRFTSDAQLVLRLQTGGFNLLSAKEVEPGVLVFRLRDQTPLGTEALGTLQMQPNSSPPAIASFSLRAIVPAQ